MRMLFALLMLLVAFANAEPVGKRQQTSSNSTSATVPAADADSLATNDSLTMVRIRYDSTGGYGASWYSYEGRDWQRWETDFPRAEKNFLFRLSQLTSLRVNPEPISLRLTDKRLFDHPLIYMSDIGWQRLNRAEKSALSQYLQRGGFLWVDDFWGNAELQSLYRNLDGLKKSWRWRTIPKGHPILTSVYELEACPQIPARIFYAQFGRTYDPPGVHRFPSGGERGVRDVNFLGLFNASDRLLAIATHNTDIADGWEREGESKAFFDRFSIDSYAFSINVVVYAMSH